MAKAGTTEPKGGNVRSVEFALGILEVVARCDSSVGVTELARTFDTTKSRIHRHLQTLVAAGYLIRNPETERYSISGRLMALGQAVSENFGLVTAARHVARALRDEVGHAVSVSQLENGAARVLLMIPSRSNIEIAVKPGSLLPLHASAQGKVTLAFGGPDLMRDTLSRELEQTSPYTITNPQELKREIEQTRQNSWAVAPNQVVIGLNALAAPVFGALGNFVGTLAMSDSIQFITDPPTDDQINALLRAAAEVSANLGYEAPRP
ncbi:IclR family transcriptional regulator [Actibacterium sp.]|uniref:IclR family transcriptional regulator n=1 Tax=Actibacterium sp. TaxID=1872125 RepID=UPI00356893A8